ncbi:MAG: sigma-70 factor domain-containing protein, partial [Anaerolineae bacterium]|nr:sigma-70 factor domain-containing protein [Anaerolineae bacterium]
MLADYVQTKSPRRSLNYLVSNDQEQEFADQNQVDQISDVDEALLNKEVSADSHDEDEDTFATKPESDLSIDDTIALYLKEISKISLLTQAEEVKLAKAIEKGKKAALLLNQPDPTQSGHSIAKLKYDVRRGQLARCKLIEANFRLVVSIAKKYVGHGVSFMDLIQEG